MKVKFWGTRGSIPTPGPATLKYGGNTSCVEIRTADNTIIILDAGSGIRELGKHLIASSNGPVEGHIMFSHTHWDHIQGFPFFGPAFMPGNRFTLYGATTLEKGLEAALAGQMEHTYFPVRLDQLAANIYFKEFDEGSLQVGSATVSHYYLNHPSVCLGYRIDADGASVVYATDTEPVSESLDNDYERGLIEFARGADLLIHDAMYTYEEFQKKHGWGHSYPEYVVKIAEACGAKRLELFHHDPEHNDEVIRSFEEMCRRKAKEDGADMEVFGAQEGLEIWL